MLKLFVRNFSSQNKRSVVLVDGCRLPFKLTGTDYKHLMAVDLARYVILRESCFERERERELFRDY